MQKRLFRVLSFVLLLASFAFADQAAISGRIHFEVTVARTASTAPVSGRLIILFTQNKPPRDGRLIQPSFINPRSVWIAAREVHDLQPGVPISVYTNQISYPAPFSKAPAGDYYVQALLDVDHNAAYRLVTPGDLVSQVEFVQGLHPASSGVVAVKLRVKVPEPPPVALPAGEQHIDFVSPSLSAFWGRPIHMRAVVVLPPGYGKGDQRYPTVYWTHGFGAKLPYIEHESFNYRKLMDTGKIPGMIYVMLDESFPTGTHEFADSVNNGPWGHALTAELIPYLESHYRMDARPSGRFLTGHSSGGWATLWLQVNYPKIFGGTWSTSPDPSDFHNFTGPDIASVPPNNAYYKPDGSPWMLVRMGNKDVVSLKDYAQQEAVLGSYGGQMSSFDYVFSPRAPDGRPMQLFDRVTGDVNPAVAAYWEQHYDIAHLVQQRWPVIGPDLKGKIHLIVGTADTFHLDESAHLLQKVLDGLGADASFTFIPGRSHFDLYKGGLTEKIAQQMYAVARPAKNRM